MKVIETYVVKEHSIRSRVPPRNIRLVRCENDLWFREQWWADGQFIGLVPVESDVAQYLIDNSKQS